MKSEETTRKGERGCSLKDSSDLKRESFPVKKDKSQGGKKRGEPSFRTSSQKKKKGERPIDKKRGHVAAKKSNSPKRKWRWAS